MYGIEVKIDGEWRAVNPPGGPPPYSFATREEAETMARVLYRGSWDNPELVRIRPEVLASCSPELASFIDPSGALRKAGLLREDGNG